MRRIVPVGKTEARRFIEEIHRHNSAPSAMQTMFTVGIEEDGKLVAVATAGRPIARMLDDGFTLEVHRACVEGTVKNANSMLYGALARAATALGYRKLITYTLKEESGASLRAAGFSGPVEAGGSSWSHSKVRVRHDITLWGPKKNTQGVRKYRWEKELVV